MEKENETGNCDKSLLGAAFSIGKIVSVPKLLSIGPRSIKCPCCDKEWNKTGRGFGFVKRGATTHVFTCFEKTLKENGFKLGIYDMELLGWVLEKIDR